MTWRNTLPDHLIEQQTVNSLKGADFAVLGQFCAKSINYCLLTSKKCSSERRREISNEFYQLGELAIIIVLVIFEYTASKLEKIGPIFSSFNPLPSLPSVATDGRKQFQCRKIVFKRASQPFSNISRQGLKIRFLSYLKHCWAKVWQKQRYMFWGKISLYFQEKRK